MFLDTERRTARKRALIGLVAAGGLLVALAPGTASALPGAAAHPQMLAPPPAATRTVTATVHFASGKSYLTSYSQRILVRALRSIPAGATVTSTKVIGYVQARSAWDNGKALGTARAVEVRAHLKAMGLKGRIDISSGGIFGNTDLSRRAVVTITYRDKPGQILAFAQPEDMVTTDDDQPLSAHATSGLRVTVRSTTPSVCTVTGTSDAPAVHAVAVGTCTLVATQPGNAAYRAAAAVTRAIVVRVAQSDPPAPASYDVTFSAQGGDVEPTATTWTEGDDAIVLPTPERTGFTFDGWFTAAEGGTAVGDAGDNYTPDADATLYAHWTAVSNERTVTFHANYTDGPASTTQTSEISAALTANPFGATQGGLTFAGWATEAGGAVVYADGATYDFAANEDLYAVWGYEVTVYADWYGQENNDLYYCGRADGACTTDDVTHVAFDSHTWMYQIVVFPNQDASFDPLNGYEISVWSPGWDIGLQGSAAFDPALSTNNWYWTSQPGYVHISVTGNATIYVGMI